MMPNQLAQHAWLISERVFPLVVVIGASEEQVKRYCESRGLAYCRIFCKILNDGELEDRYQEVEKG